jgi:hypothetical protein
VSYSRLREFVSVSFKLLYSKNVTFFKGIVLSDLGRGGGIKRVWAAFFIVPW